MKTSEFQVLPKRRRVIINLTNRPESDRTERRWFGWPFEQVFDEVVFAGSRPSTLLVHVFKAIVSPREHKNYFLVFNVSIWTLIISIIVPRRHLEIISLFQWVHPSKNIPKSLAIEYQLRRSSAVLVYDRDSLNRLKAQPGLRSLTYVAYPIVTDTNFFLFSGQNILQTSTSKSTVLCVGDHLRDDRLFEAVARKMTDTVFIRVTNAQTSLGDSSNITVRRKVANKELQQLYRDASAALILTLETRFPVGITSVAEAISCGIPLVATSGSGIGFFSETENIKFVDSKDDPNSVERALRLVMSVGKCKPEEVNLMYLSPESCTSVLKDLVERLG